MTEPTPTQHDIAVAAYYLWLAEGCPWGNDAITFVNWIESEGNLENPPCPPMPPPQE